MPTSAAPAGSYKVQTDWFYSHWMASTDHQDQVRKTGKYVQTLKKKKSTLTFNYMQVYRSVNSWVKIKPQ